MVPLETQEDPAAAEYERRRIMLVPSELARIPATTKEMFGRPGRLVVEIGCGNGSFLVDRAHQDPAALLIGAEIAAPSATRAYKRVSRSQLNNIRLYRGDGLFLLREMIAPESVSAIYVNFPDPWPRTRHVSRRVFGHPFLDVAATRLERGGCIFLTTDHADYFAYARRESERCGWFDVAVTTPPASTITTRWAKKWLEMQRPIFHLELTQRDRPRDQIQTINVIDMQHAHMEGDLNTITAFDRAVRKTQRGTVVLLNAYRSLNHGSLVFSVLVDEGDLRQEILIEARTKDGLVVVGARRFGSPLSTPGVAEAVRFATEWLVERGMRLKEAWY